MELNFWHEKWASNDIGFHESEPHPFLVDHCNALDLKAGSRVLIPLCGKTLDIAWLLSQGYRVAGAELSEVAVQQLFAALDVMPQVVIYDEIKHYSADCIDIFVGDIFDLSAGLLGVIDAIYDRGALVALPADVRLRYSDHLQKISGQASQLLVVYSYDQGEMEGPPFSLSEQEIAKHYSSNYQITLQEQRWVKGKLKGVCDAQEQLWLLKKV